MSHYTVTISDGRRIGVAEYGDPDGAPVFYFHGLPGSRLQYHPDPEVSRGTGVRVLALDRPGLGFSDPHKVRRVCDWPSDVAGVADALGIGRFGILGLSGGGPYAVASAACLGERVRKLTLVSALGPLDYRGAIGTMAPLPALYFRLARYAPWLLPLLSYPFLLVRRYPRLVEAGRPFAGISPDDRGTLAKRRDLQEMFGHDFIEATRQGIGGIMQEARLATLPWNVDVDKISAPVTLWYGDRDALTPPAMEVALARSLPNCKVKLFEGEGHFLFFRHLREILEDVRCEE